MMIMGFQMESDEFEGIFENWWSGYFSKFIYSLEECFDRMRLEQTLHNWIVWDCIGHTLPFLCA